MMSYLKRSYKLLIIFLLVHFLREVRRSFYVIRYNKLYFVIVINVIVINALKRKNLNLHEEALGVLRVRMDNNYQVSACYSFFFVCTVHYGRKYHFYQKE